MADDWQVGDLAVCVDARPDAYWGCNLIEGATYTVAAVNWLVGHPAARNTVHGRTDIGLALTEVRSFAEFGYHPDRFRKIRPDEHIACEDEFVTLLKRNRVSA